MGRPKLYFSEEERKEAQRKRQQKWVSNPENRKNQYLSNKNTQSERYSRWAKKNKEKLCAKAALERARKLQRVPKWANLEEINIFYKNRPKGYHVDHIIPLNGKRVSGFHVIDNLQYLIAEDNLSKSNKYLD
jgi:hypothetical protein